MKIYFVIALAALTGCAFQLSIGNGPRRGNQVDPCINTNVAPPVPFNMQRGRPYTSRCPKCGQPLNTIPPSYGSPTAAKLAEKPVSNVPTTNFWFKVKCPDCQTDLNAHPIAVQLGGAWLQDDGSIIRGYCLTFRCPCGGVFCTTHKFHTHVPVAVPGEAMPEIDPTKVVPAKTLKAPKQ